MRKIVAMLMAVVMLSTFAACGAVGDSGNSNVSESSSPESGTVADNEGTTVGDDGSVVTNYGAAEVDIDEELPHYTVLVTYASFTDKLGSQYKASLEYLGEALNIDFIFCETGRGEEAMTNFEAALINKPDAIIMNSLGVSYVKAAYDAGDIPIISCGMVFSSEDEAQELATYENFMGCIGVADYQAGYDSAQALYDAGCRNVLLCGITKGLAGQADLRAEGFIDGVAVHEDMRIIGEDYSRGQFAEPIASYAASYSELDGIFCTALSESVYTTIETENLSDYVKLAGIDISESTGKMFEDEVLAYIAGGNYVTNMIGFLVCYNYLMDGTRLIEDSTKTVEWNNINITNADEFNAYIKYLDSGIPAYTAGEILEKVHKLNPDYTAESFQADAKAFTLEDVASRHADMFE